MTLFVMRHGRTRWNVEGKLQGRLNSPLLPESIETTRMISDYLADKEISVIYSSPLTRCEETAKIVCGALGQTYILDERLMECDHGQCEGLTLSEAQERFSVELEKRKYDKWNIPWVGGESYADVFERAQLFSDEIILSENALVIAHETFNRCLIGLFLGWTSNQIIAYKQPNNVICKICGDSVPFEEISL